MHEHRFLRSGGKGIQNSAHAWLAAAVASAFAAGASAQTARPETGALLGLQRQTDFVFVHGLDDRNGPGLGEFGGNGSWLRAFGQGDQSTSKDGLYSVDGKLWGVQGGIGLPVWQRLDHWRFGLMFGAASAQADGTAQGSAVQSQGRGDGFGLGMYGTWRQDPTRRLGWYGDFWINYARFSNRVDTPGLARSEYDSHNGSLSGEGGYAFALGDAGGWTLTPQLQWIYIHNHSYNFIESDGTEVDGAHRGGWSSRLGLRVEQQQQPDSASVGSGLRLRPYAAINWWHDATGDEVVYNQAVSVKKLYPSDRLELKGGAGVDFGRQWKAWADVGWETGSQSYSAWAARIGARYSW